MNANLKITSDHYAALRSFLAPLASRIPAHREAVRASGKFQDLETRVRWDWFYAAVPSKWVCDELYPYLNDTHIESALRNLASELLGS